MQTHATFVVKVGNTDPIWNNAMQWKVAQCSWHSFRILWFWFWFNLFGKHRLTVIIHASSSYLFANLSGNSLGVYVLFDLVTWPFWSDGNGAVLRLINLLKFQGLSPPFFFLFKNIDGWELLICPYVHLRLMHDAPHCPSVRLWGTNCYLSSWPCSWEPIGWKLLICP